MLATVRLRFLTLTLFVLVAASPAIAQTQYSIGNPTNDNWRIGGQEADIIATTIPPSHNSESAIVAILPANGAIYTVIVRGVGNTTGIAVVEMYALN